MVGREAGGESLQQPTGPASTEVVHAAIGTAMTATGERASVDRKMTDHVLQSFVNLANNHDVSFSVTISARGSVISGQLVGVKEYLSKLGVLIASAIEGLDGNAAIDHAAEYDKIGKEVALQGNADDYLHLKDAVVLTSVVRVDPGPHQWRFKLSEVDGFQVGSTSVPLR